MTPGALVLARDGGPMAAAVAIALWAEIVLRVEAQYAGTALDMVSAHIGPEVDLPDHILQESVVRPGLTLKNTLGPDQEFGVGLKSFSATVGGVPFDFQYSSEFMGSILRRSGAMGLLAPWVRRRARLIK